MSAFLDDSAPLLSAFGEALVAELTPVVQITARYGITESVRTLLENGGTVDVNDSKYEVSTGTAVDGLSSLSSARHISYKAGQGILARWTTVYDDPVVDNLQLAGLLSAEDTFGFAYINGVFGILNFVHAKVSTNKFTFTTPAAGAENSTVTLAGIDYTVPLTAGNEAHNAFEMAVSLTAQATSYHASSNGDSVIVSDRAPRPPGVIAFSSATAVTDIDALSVGEMPTFEFIPRSSWVGDDTSWLNPQMGNVYSISMQYLGFGDIIYKIEDPETGKAVVAHTIKYANAHTIPSASNPAFRLGWVTRNSGNNTNITLSGSSAAGFIEGKDEVIADSRGTDNFLAGVGLTNTNLITIRNVFYYNGKYNKDLINPMLVTMGTTSTKGAIFTLFADATFAGDVGYTYHDEANSIAEIAKTPVEVTGGRILSSFYVSPAGVIIILVSLRPVIFPVAQLTLAARVVAVPNSDMTASMAWKEDI